MSDSVLVLGLDHLVTVSWGGLVILREMVEERKMGDIYNTVQRLLINYQSTGKCFNILTSDDYVMMLCATDNYEVQSQRRFITPKKDVFISIIILDLLLHDYFPSLALVPVSPPHGCFLSRDNLAVNTSFRRTSLLPALISRSRASHTPSYTASTFFMKFLALCCLYFNFKSHFFH